MSATVPSYRSGQPSPSLDKHVKSRKSRSLFSRFQIFPKQIHIRTWFTIDPFIWPHQFNLSLFWLRCFLWLLVQFKKYIFSFIFRVRKTIPIFRFSAKLKEINNISCFSILTTYWVILLKPMYSLYSSKIRTDYFSTIKIILTFLSLQISVASIHYHIYQPLRSGRIWHKVNF